MGNDFFLLNIINESLRISFFNKKSVDINLDKLFDSGNAVSQWIDLKPHDTIYIHQKNLSKILTTSNLTYTILGLLNIAITLDKN